MRQLLTARTAAAPVAFCRILLGTAAFVRGLKTGRDLYYLQFEPRAVQARLYEWAPEVATIPEMVVLTGIWLGASLALTIGYRAQFAAFVLFLCVVFVHLVDMNFWAHHMYFLMLMLLLISLTESDATWSVRWLREGRPTREVTVWPVLLMKIQLSLVYFFTAVAKVNPVYLSGDVLRGRGAFPAFLAEPWAIGAIAVSTVAAEFFLSFGLWIRRLRAWALLVGLVLHGLVPISFGPYGGLVVFSLATLGVYGLFVDERDVRRFAGRLADRRRVSPDATPRSG